MKINSGDPSVGIEATTKAVQGFMTAFPDMIVKWNNIYHWTLNVTSPRGNGNSVRISGYEEWTIRVGRLVSESKGFSDKAEYQAYWNT